MEVFKELLVLMVVVWTVAIILRRLGWPTVMGELVMGVVLGPAILGWVEPNEIIHVLAEMGIFFLMLHTSVETHSREFFTALRSSLGVAVVGAIAPFSVAFLVSFLYFDLSVQASVSVGRHHGSGVGFCRAHHDRDSGCGDIEDPARSGPAQHTDGPGHCGLLSPR